MQSLSTIFWNILCLLEQVDESNPEVHAQAEKRVNEAVELYKFRCQSMAPVYALRHAIINLTTPAADAALKRRDTKVVP